MTQSVESAGSSDAAQALELTQEKLCQAVKRRVCVTTVYNRLAMTLAPHIVFLRHGEPYMVAYTVEHEGRKPRNPKLATFKLIGLSDLEVTRKLFVPQPEFNPFDDAYAEGIICIVG